MSKFKKSDWQKAAGDLGIEFQEDDSIGSLSERVAFNLGMDKKSTLAEIQKGAEDHKPAPAKKKTTKKVGKKESGNKSCGFNKVIADRGERICLSIKGHEVWLPSEHADVNKSKKTVSMPAWLFDVKIGKLEEA